MLRSAIAFAALASTAMAQLMISTPASLIECQPVLLSWSGGTSPYYVSIIPGGQPSAAALIDFGEQTVTSLTWTVNITEGTSITLKVTDSTGATNYDQASTVQAGASDSCLTGSAAVVTGSATSAAVSSAAADASAASSAVSSASVAASSAAASVTSAAASVVSSVSSAAKSAASSVSSAASAAKSSGSAAASSAAASASASASGAQRTLATSGLAAAFVVGAVAIAML